MHTYQRVASIAALMAFTTTPAVAQLRDITRRASDAIERKANQKVDEKIDKAAERLVTQAFDNMFGDDDSSSGKSTGSGSKGKSSSRGFSLFPNAPTEDQYNFDAVLTYEIESTRKDQAADKALMQMHFSKTGQYAGARILPAEQKKGDGELFAIFDVKNQSMVMLVTSDDGKASMAYSWKDAARYAESAPSSTAPTASGVATTSTAVVAANPKVTYTPIGTKTISGYKAEGHRFEDAQSTVEVWVSRDASLSFGRLMGATSSMKQVRGAMPSDYPEGMLLETNTYDKTNGERGRMTVTKVEKNANVRIAMSDYPRVGKASSK